MYAVAALAAVIQRLRALHAQLPYGPAKGPLNFVAGSHAGGAACGGGGLTAAERTVGGGGSSPVVKSSKPRARHSGANIVGRSEPPQPNCASPRLTSAYTAEASNSGPPLSPSHGCEAFGMSS